TMNLKRSFYSISLDSNTPSALFTPSFANAISNLPSSYSSAAERAQYASLIQNYGPYYVKSAVLGVEAKMYTRIESCALQSFTTTEVTTHVSGEFNGVAEDATANVDQKSQLTKVEKCLASHSTSSVRLRGGDIN